MLDHLLKPGPTYKMSRATKTGLAQIVDPQRRAEMKRLMIHSDLYGSQMAPRRERRNNYTDNTTSAE